MVCENDQISSAVLTTSIVITIVVIESCFIVDTEKQSDDVNL